MKRPQQTRMCTTLLHLLFLNVNGGQRILAIGRGKYAYVSSECGISDGIAQQARGYTTLAYRRSNPSHTFAIEAVMNTSTGSLQSFVHVSVAREKSSTRLRERFCAMQLQAVPHTIECHSSIICNLPLVSRYNTETGRRGNANGFMNINFER